MWKLIASGIVFALVFIVALVFLQATEVVTSALLPILSPVLDHLFAWIQENPIKIVVATVVALLVTAKLFYLRQQRVPRDSAAIEHPH